jgi:hypothetical protein
VCGDLHMRDVTVAFFPQPNETENKTQIDALLIEFL